MKRNHSKFLITEFLFKSSRTDKTKDTVDSTSPRVKRLRTNDYANQTDDSASRIFQSQPTPQVNTTDADSGLETTVESRTNDFCFSQPTLMEDLILCTQLNSTQGQSQNAFHRLVKRMTRFFVTTNYDDTIKRLTQIVGESGYNWKSNDTSIVSVLNCYRVDFAYKKHSSHCFFSL